MWKIPTKMNESWNIYYLAFYIIFFSGNFNRRKSIIAIGRLVDVRRQSNFITYCTLFTPINSIIDLLVYYWSRTRPIITWNSQTLWEYNHARNFWDNFDRCNVLVGKNDISFYLPFIVWELTDSVYSYSL